MKRTVYETDSDLEKELELISLVSEKWQCSYFKLPISYRLDFALTRNDRIVSFVEVRCRNNSIDKYSTIVCAVNKRVKALELSAATDVKSIFLVKYTDKIAYIDFAVKPDSISIGGRTGKNRRDYEDVEPICHYSVERLTLINM